MNINIKLPHNSLAEKSLLSCLFLAVKGKNEDLINEILSQDESIFFNDLHKRLFCKFKELVSKGYTPDAISLSHFMQDKNMNYLAGGDIVTYIIEEIYPLEASAYGASTHIKILQDLFKRRSYLNKIISFNNEYVKFRNETINEILNLEKDLDENKIKYFEERIDVNGFKKFE